jgi:8-oxo-dGTP diphosphatase
VLIRDGRVLLGRRRGAHGQGTWAPPGGRLEAGEPPATAVERELKEETGLEARTIAPLGFTSDVFAEGLHYVTLHHAAAADGEPAVREPSRCEGWEWFPTAELPAPLFAPFASLVAAGWPP